MEPVIAGKEGSNVKKEGVKAYGVKSLFNNVNAVPIMEPVRKANNALLLDTPDNRRSQRDRSVCTIKELVRASGAGEMGRAIYNYSDFMYCKHLGKIPNNYLITLRRFPFPCGDYITYTMPNSSNEKETQGHLPDIGRLVTWMGTPGNDMSNILKYSYKMNWKPLDAKIQEEQDHGDSSGGIMNKIFNSFDSKYQQQVAEGVASGSSVVGYAGELFESTKIGGGISKFLGGSADAPYSSGRWLQMYDQNKTYGPIDVIAKTNIRDRGLEFEQTVTLVFDYELRSYDGINGKAAMLDLLGNILAVTYSMGTFWGGSIRMYGAHQSNLFANLPLFQSGTNMSNVVERGKDSFKSLTDSIMGMYNNQQGGTWYEKLGGMMKSIGGGFGNMLLGGLLNKLGRPHKMAFDSFLSPRPTGPWHLTIGNPKNPILSMGNMILKSAEIEHYGPLGLDDFPTGLKLTVSLEHGKPRDTIGIEQMYLAGNNRIYAPMGRDIERMYNESKTYKGDEDKEKIFSSFGEMLEPTKNLDSKKDEVNTYMKFFGTTNMKFISRSSAEAMFGAETPEKKSN